MKMQVYSDLHCEFSYFDIPKPDDPNTVLVLAGDTHIGVRMMQEKYIPKWSAMFKHVFVVFGNHCYYKHNIDDLGYRIRKRISKQGLTNVTVLDDKVVKYEGIQIIGGTMWTDFNHDPMTKAICQFKMNDYRMIRKGSDYRRIYANDTYNSHLNFLKLLESVDFSKPTIVVTHHCPSEIFVDRDRYGDRANDIHHAYYSDLSDFIKEKEPLIWIAGHTHKRVCECLYSTLLYSNPRGYETDKFSELVDGFKHKEILEVNA